MKSNEVLLGMRQILISEFKKYEYIIIPFVRFILVFSALRVLIEVTNYSGSLSSVLPILFIALIGTFVPEGCILVGSIILTTLFIFPANPIFATVLFIILAIVYLGFMRLFPRESLLTIIMLIAFAINMEFAVPIIAALLGNYICIVPIIIGVIIWYVMPELALVIQSTAIDKSEIVDMITSISELNFKGLLLDQEMLVIIVVFFIVFSAIYIIRKQSIDYAPYIAIGVGAVVNLLGFGLAILFFGKINISMPSVILWTIVYSLLGVIVQFFAIALDYQRAEVVNFEDDDNYYYVKVVPKIHLSTKHTSVKHVYTDTKDTKDLTSIIMEPDEKDMGI